MSFLDIAVKRYSVRAYKSDAVGDDLLMQVLEAGRLAPSACNKQPWAFIVIRDQGRRGELSAVYSKPWFTSAPVIIAVCADTSVAWSRSDGKSYADVDAAIAMDHMTLAATDLGLGTCWIGAFNREEAQRLLCLPPHLAPIAFTPLGHPDSVAPVKNRKSLDEIVHREYFGNKE